MATEDIKISINLRGHGWDEHWPKCRISVDGSVFYDEFIKGEHNVTFTATVPDDSTGVLEIEYYGKDYKRDIVLDADGNPVKTVHIEIGEILFEDISIGQIPYNLSEVHVTEPWYLNQDSDDYPNPRHNDMQLSWNSSWRLEFQTPIYIWLLENL